MGVASGGSMVWRWGRLGQEPQLTAGLPADADGLLGRALLLGQLEPAVELCLKEERFADAILLAQAGGTDLLKRTQERYLAKSRTKISSVGAREVVQGLSLAC